MMTDKEKALKDELTAVRKEHRRTTRKLRAADEKIEAAIFDRDECMTELIEAYAEADNYGDERDRFRARCRTLQHERDEAVKQLNFEREHHASYGSPVGRAVK